MSTLFCRTLFKNKRYYRFAFDLFKYKRCFHPKNISVDFHENTFKTLDIIFSEVPILTNSHDEALMIQINEEWNNIILYDIPAFITEERDAAIFRVHMKQIRNENGIHLFKNVSELALKFISLPNSNASSERELSQLNRQMTVQRACLIFPTIRGISLTYSYIKDGGVSSFEPTYEMFVRMIKNLNKKFSNYRKIDNMSEYGGTVLTEEYLEECKKEEKVRLQKNKVNTIWP